MRTLHLALLAIALSALARVSFAGSPIIAVYQVSEYHGAMADISRSASPDKVSSAQVTIEPNGLTKDEALSIVASMVTTWEQE